MWIGLTDDLFCNETERWAARRLNLNLHLIIATGRRVEPKRPVEVQRAAHIRNDDIDCVWFDSHLSFS